MQRSEGIIYFIRAGDGPIKIGYTENDVKARLSQLQSSNAKKLHILATAKGTEKDEKMLHARFIPYHINGEWFEPSRELLDYIYPMEFRLPKITPFEFPLDLKAKLIEVKKIYIEAALKKTKGNKTHAAKLLNISHKNLLYTINK